MEKDKNELMELFERVSKDQEKAELLRNILMLMEDSSLIFQLHIKRIFIVPGRNSYELAKQIAEASGIKLAEVVWTDFTDGESKPQYKDNIRGAFLYIVNSTNAPADNLNDVELLTDAAIRASAERIIVVTPYFGGQRQERKDKGRVPITAKLNADKLAAVGVYKLIAIDLHADAIQAFFPRFDHLFASAIFVPYIKKLDLEYLHFVSLDTGGAKRIEKYADLFNVPFGICYKQRDDGPDKIKKMMLLGDVKGKDVVMIDDIIDTAGSVEKFTTLVLDAGARSVRCFFTHPVLSGTAYERIKNMPNVEYIVTDTIPIDPKFFELPNFKVLTVVDFLADVIKRDTKNESISSMFVF